MHNKLPHDIMLLKLNLKTQNAFLVVQVFFDLRLKGEKVKNFKMIYKTSLDWVDEWREMVN